MALALTVVTGRVPELAVGTLMARITTTVALKTAVNTVRRGILLFLLITSVAAFAQEVY